MKLVLCFYKNSQSSKMYSLSFKNYSGWIVISYISILPWYFYFKHYGLIYPLVIYFRTYFMNELIINLDIWKKNWSWKLHRIQLYFKHVGFRGTPVSKYSVKGKSQIMEREKNGKRESNLSQTRTLERYRAIQKLYFDLDLVIKMYTRGISSSSLKR